jgi:hypothetical protein
VGRGKDLEWEKGRVKKGEGWGKRVMVKSRKNGKGE